MKNLFFLLITLFAVTSVNAQSTSPRFGTAKNQDNTGRVLTYKLATVTDAAGADSATVSPSAWETLVRVNVLDSITFRNPSLTQSYFGDKIVFIASGTTGDRVKFTGSNWVATGPAVLSSGAVAVITFRFNGSKWVESDRTVQ